MEISPFSYNRFNVLTETKRTIVVFQTFLVSGIDVPRPLSNDLCVILFLKIDAECVK